MVAMRVTVIGGPELRRQLIQLNPKENPRIPVNALERVAGEIQRNAKDKQIAAGGRGKKRAIPPLPDRLTSRTGTLRRSIGVNRRPLPRAIEIGTPLVYGAVHEFGWGRYPVRAFLQPALDAISPRIGGIVAEEWRKAGGL
jgi:hypothetical protein